MASKKGFRKNLKWLIGLGFIVFLIVLLVVSPVGKEVKGIAGVYTEPSIYENAISIATKSDEVVQKLGRLESVGFMAIMEGAIAYSNNNNSIDMSFRIKGSKGKGRMHILAYRKEKEWMYKKIEIGIKITKETIQILE